MLETTFVAACTWSAPVTLEVKAALKFCQGKKSCLNSKRWASCPEMMSHYLRLGYPRTARVPKRSTLLTIIGSQLLHRWFSCAMVCQ